MEVVTSAFLNPLCERVIHAALEEYRLVRSVEVELKKLRSTVSLIKGLLQDAEEKQVKEKAVREWLGSLKQLLFDAEDILDEAATDATLQTGEVDGTNSVTGVRAKVRNAICCFGSMAKLTSRHATAHEIKTVREKLDDISKQRADLGLQVLSGGNSLPTNRRNRRSETSLLGDESCIIGRDDEKKRIKKLLLTSEEGTEPSGSQNSARALSIFGMGGVGKTTLAKLVFNDPEVKQRFEPTIWVCVSEDFECERIIREIMDVVFTSDEKKELLEMVNWDLAQRRFKEKIEKKKFLLVLDDVWEENPHKWEKLWGPLEFGGMGSKIIVTTRSEKTSRMVGEIRIPLNNLSSEDLWPIFERYAFDRCEPNRRMQLESVGRQIVGRLKGSPLAAKTIGRLLNESLDVKHWKRILKCDIFSLQQQPEDISPILKLSYDHLYGHLKPCFAYCSLFPKDYKFKKDELVKLWMAQNFIQTTIGFDVESVGTDNFKDLLYKSFFQQDTARFVMHDLIHDLAESVSQGDCCRLGYDRSKEIPEVARHLSIATNTLDLSQLMELWKHGNLRTLLFLQGCTLRLSPHLGELFMRLKRLRVLELSNCNITELPASLGNLKHLRYINLSRTGIRELPDSLCNLLNLQVLKLKGCGSLSALPSKMSLLINLRHLGASCELVSNIQGLGKLTALQEIEVSGRKVRELGDMGMLKQLRIRGLEQIVSKEEAVQARLDAKEHLDVLGLAWDRGRDGNSVNQTLEEEVLESLRPVDSITQMYVAGYGGVKSPSWVEDDSWMPSSSLERIILSDCGNWEVLPPLGRLCCLKFLSFQGMKRVRSIGPQFLGSGGADGGGGVRVPGFPALEELHLAEMPEWEEWKLPTEGEGGRDDDDGQRQQRPQHPPPPPFLPRLRILHINNCPKLRELPPLPPTLTRLEIFRVGFTRLPGWLGCRGGDGDMLNEMPSSSSSSSSLPSLFFLAIELCPNLASLRAGLLQHPLGALERLRISTCKELALLPDRGFRHLSSLKSLTLEDCPKLSPRPPSATQVDFMPSSLEQLEIRGCGEMMEGLLSVASLQKLTNLSRLVVDGVSSDAVARLGELTSLTFLDIRKGDLIRFPETGGGLPSSLGALSISDDGHLDDRTLSACLRGLTSLRSLDMDGCPAVTSLPAAEVLHQLTALDKLHIRRCEQLASLGGSHALVSLKHLSILECPKLLHLGEAAAASPSSSPTSPPLLRPSVMPLKSLLIQSSSPQQIAMWLRQCPSLNRLIIISCPQLTCFDDDGGDDGIGRHLEAALLTLAPSLRALEIAFCGHLRSLPSKLRLLSSLQRLSIDLCTEIQCLPVGGLPESLEELSISRCPALVERCNEEGGPDRPLISHIPHVLLIM